MKKDFLSKVKGAILSKEEAKTISGGYNGSFIDGSPCSFIVCGSYSNQGAKVATPAGCTPRNLYYYKPNPSLYCVGV
ncbi:MAG TPA: hypothetical protein VFS71_05120 [Flavobacterium sp.]|uniref:hypothetical protein n=1 Tax=Flavobacterium sp. TaxID=239 RepID=UPI002DBA7E8E|nr:hypothetical protein [Flavobacterium sp.]HEU4789043.1 hypothetical protein [Flavobacterium sp.]